MAGNISIVIGSWGSYNECNERALGSKWLDLSDYEEWDEIVEELKKEGFELDGIDEELFIQDVDGIEDGSINWDYVNPEELFNTLNASGVLDDDYKYLVYRRAYPIIFYVFVDILIYPYLCIFILCSHRRFSKGRNYFRV